MKFEQAKELCYKLWDVLEKKGYDHLDDGKKKALIEIGYGNKKIINQCFACHFVKTKNKFGETVSDCSMCPIEWIKNQNTIVKIYGKYNSGPCEEDSSLYHKWTHSSSIEERKKYAKKIKKLPWVNKKEK